MVKQRTAKVSQRTKSATWSAGVWASAVLGCFAVAGVGDADASGIAAARFGGEHGHPTTDNPTAIYYNPAGIALSKGTHIFVDGTIALRWAGYDRPSAGPDDVAPGSSPVQNNQETLGLAPGANDGKASLFNAIASPFLGVSSDFGTDFIYGGLSVSFPFGGSAVWDRNSAYAGNEQFPGAADGQQRWYSIDGSIRSMYITGAMAFNIRKIGLSIGLSGSAIRSNVSTLRARNADGTDDLVTVNSDGSVAYDADGNTSLKEGRSLVDVKGWQGGFGIGLVYDVLKQGKYFIGASYTSQPNVAGGMTLKGTLKNSLATSQRDQSDVEFTQSLPDIFRLGFRVRPTDKYELRIFGDYTRWSVSDRQCLINVTSKNEHTCDFGSGENALDEPETYGAGTGEEDNPAAGVVRAPAALLEGRGRGPHRRLVLVHPRARGLPRCGLRQQRGSAGDARPRADGHEQVLDLRRLPLADHQAPGDVLHRDRAHLPADQHPGEERAQPLPGAHAAAQRRRRVHPVPPAVQHRRRHLVLTLGRQSDPASAKTPALAFLRRVRNGPAAARSWPGPCLVEAATCPALERTKRPGRHAPCSPTARTHARSVRSLLSDPAARRTHRPRGAAPRSGGTRLARAPRAVRRAARPGLG